MSCAGDFILKLGLQGHHFGASSISILFVDPCSWEKLIGARGILQFFWRGENFPLAPAREHLFLSLLLLTIQAEHLANLFAFNPQLLNLGFG